MSDVVWVALISAGGVIVASLMTQLLVMRNAAKQAERAMQQEALQWQRNEAIRLQKEAEKNLQDFWRAIVETQDRLLDGINSKPNFDKFSEGSISTAATRAYAIALVLIPNLRELSHDYCVACATVDNAIHDDQKHASEKVVLEWRRAYDLVEAAVIQEAAHIARKSTEESAPTLNK
ncbi:hypothetical protein CTR2_R19410 [Comamonas thiooxydans]|uniref:hypothetical protein n=1 Tax=Comamonas thiooxydans TaxID=363952 RepID=UPI000B35FD86|nr:hypothetical protein [Comamonas thiooxydans]BDR08603.1 hypothetical protein CTR2_R19410 [Comamonas thiooxydans]